MNGRLIRVTILLSVIFAFAGINDVLAQTEPTTATVSRAKATKADSNRVSSGAPEGADFTTDLTPLLKGMKLQLGTNFVTKTRDGLSVYALVQVTELTVKDSRGHIVSGAAVNPTARRNPQSSASGSYVAAPGTGGDDDPRCWHCYDKGGQTHCFEIACPFLAAPGTGGEN